MIRSKIQSTITSQHLDVNVGACDWTASNPEEKSKSIRFGYVRCLRTNYYARYICGVVVLLSFVYFKHNTIESTVSNLRNISNRFLIGFELKSSAFKDGHSIPSIYNTTFSPPLHWKYQPSSTKSFALIIQDLDTPNQFKHWVIYNIPSNITDLWEGILVWPIGAAVIRNDYSRYRYDGPSPRDGRQHRYAFRLFALSVNQLELSSSGDTGREPTYEDLYMAMKPFILKKATLMGTYNAMNHD